MKALGAPSSARIYLAGGKPFGGSKALQPLASKFPNLVTKEMLAREDELSPYTNKSSALAAIDYIVSLSSEVFIPSHGGNMARTMKVRPPNFISIISFMCVKATWLLITFCYC